MLFFIKIWTTLKSVFYRNKYAPKVIIKEEKAFLKIQELNARLPLNKGGLYKEDVLEQCQIVELAKIETARIIVEMSESNSELLKSPHVGKKKLLELHELRKDLQKLEERKLELRIQAKEILPIARQDLTQIDSKLVNLFSSFQQDHNEVARDNKWQDLDKGILDSLFNRLSLFQKYKRDEFKRIQKEEAFKKAIRQKLSQLETHLNKGQLPEASALIKILTYQLKPDLIKELIRLAKAKDKLKEKELEIFKRKQDRLLKQQQEEARKLQEQAQQLLDAAVAEQRNRQEAKEKSENEAKKHQDDLNQLLTYRDNWKDFEFTLNENQIEFLYHFTDKTNIASIIKHGGLYSWDYCDKNGIQISRIANSTTGRAQDRKFNLQNYVRLSFVADHPMKHIALKEGRISNPCVLLVSRDVCFFNDTQFSNMNAADSDHLHRSEYSFFKNLRFDLFNRSYFGLEEDDRKRFQAEIMVKTWIPIKYIVNINDF